MTIPTHLALGLLIGVATGHPLVGLLASTLIDLDHMVVYAKHGVLRSPKLFWKTVTDNEDPYGGQRGWLHSLLVSVPILLVVYFVWPSFAPVIILSYFGHIVLDVFDSADYWPLYPSKKINIRGPISFFSWQEIVVSVLSLIGVFALIAR